MSCNQNHRVWLNIPNSHLSRGISSDITFTYARHPFPSKTFDNGFELVWAPFFFFFDFVFFPRFLRPPPSTYSVVDAERYMPVISFTRSGSLYLIGVADFAKELLAYLGMYAARRGFLPTLTSVEIAPPSSSSLSGLLLLMQPCNARFHHGFILAGPETVDCVERSVHDRCRIFMDEGMI